MADWTYYGPDPADPKRMLLFDTTTCDLCGKEVIAPNSVGCLNNAYHLEMAGLKYKDPKELDEIGCNDDGDAVCSDCDDS